MVTWQYQTVEGSPNPPDIHRACVEFGKEGWELCGVMPVVKNLSGGLDIPGMPKGQIPVVVLIFKRPSDWEA